MRRTRGASQEGTPLAVDPGRATQITGRSPEAADERCETEMEAARGAAGLLMRASAVTPTDDHRSPNRKAVPWDSH
jgi:hypothetical protein